MMIRPDNKELASAISIALLTAKPYAVRRLFSASRAFDRTVAIDTLTSRVMAALRPYEITREALPHECAVGTMPLFPDL